MNERIRELAEQAWEYAQLNSRNLLTHSAFETFDKKFAELIVGECVGILMKPDYAMTHPEELGKFNEGWVKGRLLGIEHIKEHFGIKP